VAQRWRNKNVTEPLLSHGTEFLGRTGARIRVQDFTVILLTAGTKQKA